MEKEANTNSKSAKQPQEESLGEQSPQMSTPNALPSSRLLHRGRPHALVASTKGEASGRQKWLGLLESEHSKSSPEALTRAAAIVLRDRLGSAEFRTGNESDTPTPTTLYKDWRSTR
ncbi:hypothetical protein MRX96_040150 [Rhipicephalus microplus]